MRAVARAVGLLVAVAVLTWAVFPSSTVSRSQIDWKTAAFATAGGDAPATRHAQPDALDSAVDLYGNEVSDAIATYSLDPTGSLYEVHSPQTEVPKLGSPKS